MPLQISCYHPPLSRVFAIVNQKRGDGKTTTANNLAASLAANDISVHVIDSDPQGNATTGLGIAKTPDSPSLYHVLLGDSSAASAIKPTAFEGLHLIPADKNLIGAALELVDQENREFRLRDRIAEIRDQFQFILIDCPPSLDLLTLNALIAADAVIVPIQCEFFALEGVSELMDTLDRVRSSFEHDLKVAGILLTMYDDRTSLARQVAADLRRILPGMRFSRRSFPAAFVLPKPPASASPSLRTTRAPRALKAIFNSPKKSSTMNKPESPRRALGKGLGAPPAPTKPTFSAQPRRRPRRNRPPH